MSICAIVPASQMTAANAALEALGRGPRNFAVAVYAGVRPGWAGLHAAGDPAFAEQIKALSGVVHDETEGDPRTRFAALCAAQSAVWGANVPPLPDSGNVVVGQLYRYGDSELWMPLQPFDRSIWGGPPSELAPSLIAPGRVPGVPAPWRQPSGAIDAYLLVDPFTGVGEVCTHNGQTWRVSQQSAAGGINTFEPGVFGWEVI